MKITEVPERLMLTSEDIRWARHTHLSALTGIDPSVFAAWGSNRGISERSLEQLAERLGMEKSAVLEGFQLRRKDNAIARGVHQKFDELIELVSIPA